MIQNPFRILQPFSDRLQAVLSTKADGTPADREIADALGAGKVAALWQVHGKRVIIVRSETSRIEQADGLITDTPGLALCIRAADCQTFLVYAPAENVAGLMHVGWRGLDAGIIPNFFDVLKQEWGIEAHETFVGAGPSLCATCAVFTDPPNELVTVDPMFFKGKHVDLQGFAESQLLSCGLPRERFERIGDCTACHAGYWTYRGGDQEAVKRGSTNILACVLRPEYHRG